ncbi:MAG TPA: hypothetical protein DCS93_10495 [Microscillaceae bacterium]|nr:hypothetical protein [Microscillaceae bacterium]
MKPEGSGLKDPDTWERVHEGFLRYYFSFSSVELETMNDDEFARHIAILEYIREQERLQTAISVNQGVFGK